MGKGAVTGAEQSLTFAAAGLHTSVLMAKLHVYTQVYKPSIRGWDQMVFVSSWNLANDNSVNIQ